MIFYDDSIHDTQIGDIIIYNGYDPGTTTTGRLVRQYLIKGNSYKVLKIASNDFSESSPCKQQTNFYLCYNYSNYDPEFSIWVFPHECFCINYGKKYSLL